MTAAPLPDGVRIRHPDRLYIDGRWVAPEGDGRLEIVSPDAEAVVAVVAEASVADMARAAAAARRAFDEGPWPRLAPAERAALLRRMVEALEARTPELCAAWTAQVGGLASFAPTMVGGATATFAQTLALADTFDWEKTVPSPMAAAALIVREPVGVVAAIAPWNAPYATMIGKVGPALLAGCTVVMKPAPETPLEAYVIAEIAEEVGLPPGVLNLVPANRDASDTLVCDARIDKVSFTGSTLAGRRIGQVCADRVARCTLELGGKSAAIVLDDFATEEAARLLASTITVMSGQVCAMLSRAIVPRRRHDELAEAIAAEMGRIRIGPSSDPETQMGPLAMKRQLERVEDYIAKGRACATLVAGGERPAHMNRGYFIQPTLFSGVDNGSLIAREEIFGPVLSLIPCEDEADAIRIANDSVYGLNGSVLTHDSDAAYRVGRAVRSGNFGQNGLRADFSLPFGGFKQSGVGREGGPEGLMAYLETKTLLLDALPGHLAP
jgi:acyl-CoA reductase-like NAD-dependent aldehyde dehydrogenase